MSKAPLLLALALAGCTMQNFNRSMLATAHAGIACDYGQTLEVARRGWPDGGATEGNPILGPAPSPRRLAVYDLTAGAALTAVYLRLPERWRWAPPLLVALVQLQTITLNTVVAPKPWCGIR